MSDFIFNHLGKMLLGFIFVLLGLMGYAIYDEVTAEKLELRKDSWGCTAAHEESTVTYVSYDGGKTQTPIYGTTTVCDQWTRK